LVKNRCDDNVQVLAKSLISLTIWCFNSLHQIILQVNEQPEMWNHQNQNVVLILNILNLICKENKTNCLLYIASISEEQYWSQLHHEFTGLAQDYKMLPQMANEVAFCLKEVEENLFDISPTKLKRLMAKDISTSFEIDQKLSLEILLSHQNSPLYINSTPEAAAKIIDDIRSCFQLSVDETIRVLIHVGIKAVDHMTQRGKWVSIMYIKIPSILSQFASQNLFYILEQYLRSKEVHLNKNQNLKMCIEGFIEALKEHQLISQHEAQSLNISTGQNPVIFQEIKSTLFQVEKCMNRPDGKIIQNLFEKFNADGSYIIYIAGALGKINHLTVALLQASQQDGNKDTIFGNVFLIIWRMVRIFGKQAVFKDINPQNFHIANWFEVNFKEDKFSKTQIINEPIQMNEIEILLQKLFEPPKKGNDHCGNPSQVLKTASKTIEMLLKASVYNAQSVDDEKLFTALVTLRDNSRVGFMVAYARLVQLALAAETPLALKAQYCLVAYQNPKYKSKMTQQFITANCEDLLRDVFCVGEDFQFDQNSIKSKFSELGASNVKGNNLYFRRPTFIIDNSEEIGILLNDILLNQSVTQTDLIQLSWNVNSMGTELFTRFLTSFIYQQRRR